MSNFYDRLRIEKYGNDLVSCKICGKKYARIGSHVVQLHGYILAKDYYNEFGLSRKEGTSETYRNIMKEHVVQNGTINNLVNGASKRFTKKDSRIITSSWWANRNKVQANE